MGATNATPNKHTHRSGCFHEFNRSAYDVTRAKVIKARWKRELHLSNPLQRYTIFLTCANILCKITYKIIHFICAYEKLFVILRIE